MSFRSMRERRLLSQERVAEMSGLSLRTVQRLEAGHRVSYASLRTLAVTFEMNVDLLERELYAMKQPTDEFVEIPRWARLLNAWPPGGPRPSRRDVQLVEAFCVGSAVIVFGVSFLVTTDMTAKVLRTGAAVGLLAGYLASVFVRILDAYKLWPDSGGGAPVPTVRSWRRATAEYAFLTAMTVLGVVLFYWLAF